MLTNHLEPLLKYSEEDLLNFTTALFLRKEIYSKPIEKMSSIYKVPVFRWSSRNDTYEESFELIEEANLDKTKSGFRRYVGGPIDGKYSNILCKIELVDKISTFDLVSLDEALAFYERNDLAKERNDCLVEAKSKLDVLKKTILAYNSSMTNLNKAIAAANADLKEL